MHFLDAPQAGSPIGGLSVEVRGWIVSETDEPLSEPRFTNLSAGQEFHLHEMDRSDVRAVYPGRHLLGFQRIFPVRELLAGEQWEVRFVQGARPEAFPVPLSLSPEVCADWEERKRRKLARIRPLLTCPVCQSGDLGTTDDPRCPRCGQTYRFTGSAYDFLTDELSREAGIKVTENVSSHGYDADMLGIIEACRNGLVLDAGAGHKAVYYDNVVNLEIVDYPTTDVIGAGERLPFLSESFDAVLSVAVLEHVRDPFRCAKELVRVLKPGGRILAAVPFLQPLHAYPDHYYNMTGRGLINLFEGQVQIDRLWIPEAGHPIHALTWFLSSYLRGLPEAIAVEFKRLTVADLLANPGEMLAKEFVQRLSQSASEELACGTCLVGRKANV